MRFGVLGPLTVWDGEGEPVRVPEAKVRALLAALLVHEGRPVSADRLIDDLWGDRPPGNPANALQSKVSQLRRAIGRDRVVHQAPGYRLRVDSGSGSGSGDEVDVFRFRALVARARDEREPRRRAELLTEALDLWRGPAYADLADEEFVRAAADRLTEQRLAVLEDQAEARLAAGDHTLLTGELASLVAQHPLRERLRAVQIRALYLAGRQSEALASYASLRGQLAEDLGLDPGPELTALHEAILRQDPELAGPVASATSSAATAATGTADKGMERTPAPTPAPTPTRPRTNLPTPLTPLVGRDQPTGQVTRLLSTARLVTLTGPGGVGKTRLALEAAGRVAGAEVSDGVWLVEFAGVPGGSGVDALAQVVAGVLGLRDDMPSGAPGPGPATGSVPRLAHALRERRLLLVLDNCEQVVEEAAGLTDSLLRAAPGLRILATSQEPLGLTGESVFLVEPLRPADAVSLFTARVATSAPGFTLTDAGDGGGGGGGGDSDDAAAVAEICRRLDGIPLALELAATRVRALGVRELADRLGDRFRLLSSGQRGAPPRQQTLRAMIDWSWELLSAPERIVLRRLAVHHDGCTLDAAEAVCAGDGVAREDVLDLVTRLVDRSLVVMAPGPAGTAPRYRLLESVAAYARDRLREMEDLGGVRERHLRYYLDLAERAEPRLRDGDQRVWLRRLDAEGANLRAALASGRGDEEGVRLGVALTWWWLLRGRLSEALRELTAVLDRHPDRGELRSLRGAFALLTGERPDHGPAVAEHAVPRTPDGARSLWLCAYGLFSAGEPAVSEDVNDRALRLAEAVGDRWSTAAALSLRAMHALIRGDLDTIGRDGLRGAGIFRELGDRWGELQTVAPLAALAEIKGDYEEAARRQEEGLRIARELGLAAEVSARLSGLGRLALLTREWGKARELHEQARALAVEQGYRYGEIHAEMGLALGARRAGDLAAAESHLLSIRDRHADVSSPAGDHLLHAELGFIAELRADGARAEAEHRTALDIAHTLAEGRAIALSLEGLAGAATLAGDLAGAERAAELLGAADTARRDVGAPLPPAERGDVDRIAQAARAALGERAFAEAFGRGARGARDTEATQRA